MVDAPVAIGWNCGAGRKIDPIDDESTDIQGRLPVEQNLEVIFPIATGYPDRHGMVSRVLHRLNRLHVKLAQRKRLITYQKRATHRIRRILGNRS
ncbi:hypothetical protein LP421_28985 [Rhizobium sp. RCAM05350]|nr:hypothetical protein LP421_28985 [Rhizobium sp. RCAM05350]